jgi:E3 ubiquitin-protein ligase HECTD2
VEDYLLSCFSSFNGINASFYTRHPRHTPRVGSESWGRRQQPIANQESRAPNKPEVQSHVYELDPKLLLLGDFAENGTWWAGAQEEGEAA